MSNTQNYFMKLRMILRHFDIIKMTQQEINYLQLYYMEHLKHDDIAILLGIDAETITALEEKFTTSHLPNL